MDGCFWHGCPLHYVRPRSSRRFWAEKLATNVARDHRQTLALEAEGWIVVRAWEHEVDEALDQLEDRIRSAVRGEPEAVGPCRRVIEAVPRDPESRWERWRTVDLRDLSAERWEERRRTTTRGRRPISS